MRVLAVILVTLFLQACASTHAKQFQGKSLTDLRLDKGKPVNIIKMPDGRRAYQYYWGGGTYVTPQYTTGTINSSSYGSGYVIGNSISTRGTGTANINVRTTPASVISSKGCLLSFIAEKRGKYWIIVETRWPKKVFC